MDASLAHSTATSIAVAAGMYTAGGGSDLASDMVAELSDAVSLVEPEDVITRFGTIACMPKGLVENVLTPVKQGGGNVIGTTRRCARKAMLFAYALRAAWMIFSVADYASVFSGRTRAHKYDGWAFTTLDKLALKLYENPYYCSYSEIHVAFECATASVLHSLHSKHPVVYSTVEYRDFAKSAGLSKYVTTGHDGHEYARQALVDLAFVYVGRSELVQVAGDLFRFVQNGQLSANVAIDIMLENWKRAETRTRRHMQDQFKFFALFVGGLAWHVAKNASTHGRWVVHTETQTTGTQTETRSIGTQTETRSIGTQTETQTTGTQAIAREVQGQLRGQLQGQPREQGQGQARVEHVHGADDRDDFDIMSIGRLVTMMIRADRTLPRTDVMRDGVMRAVERLAPNMNAFDLSQVLFDLSLLSTLGDLNVHDHGEALGRLQAAIVRTASDMDYLTLRRTLVGLNRMNVRIEGAVLARVQAAIDRISSEDPDPHIAESLEWSISAGVNGGGGGGGAVRGGRIHRPTPTAAAAVVVLGMATACSAASAIASSLRYVSR
jgi:hypothetical protein